MTIWPYFRKILRFLQENLTIFVEKSDCFYWKFWQLFRKIWRFFKENLPIFTGKFTVFTRKSYGLYKNFWQFFRKIWRIFEENMPRFTRKFTIFTRKSDDSCRKIERSLQDPFLQVAWNVASHFSHSGSGALKKVDDHSRKVWKFLQKNLASFAEKIADFSEKFSDFCRKI